MSQPLSREPTKEELEQARQLALALSDVVLTADIATGFGAIGMLLEAMFLKSMKSEYILAGFDDFTKFTRESLERSIRRAHN